MDWQHTQANHQRSDRLTAEVEHGFGVLTLEVEVPFATTTTTAPTASGSRVRAGFDNVDLGARCPVYQFVSTRKWVDTTCGLAVEVGIPTRSVISQDTEVVPKAFFDLKLGEHLTVQSIVGYSQLFGSDADGGLATWEYGLVFGYTIPHTQFPLPRVLQFIPVFELSGATELNKDTPGHNSLLGNAGFRVNLKSLGAVQPRLGLGYIFPIDSGGRAELHWGVVTSVVLEY